MINYKLTSCKSVPSLGCRCAGDQRLLFQRLVDMEDAQVGFSVVHSLLYTAVVRFDEYSVIPM